MTQKLIKISKYRPSIFQGTFEFRDSHGMSLAIEHPLESVLRALLIGLLVLLTACYLYFVTASVLNVIARKEALSSIAMIQGEIGGLEQKYFKLSQAISQERGAALGLAPVPASNTQYVKRPGALGAATIRSDVHKEI